MTAVSLLALVGVLLLAVGLFWPRGLFLGAFLYLGAALAGRLEAVIGQLRVAPGSNEITAALALLKSLPLEGAIVTGDAEFCQRAICQSIRDRGGDYLFTIKANQPRLMADIAVAFGDAFPPRAGRRAGRPGGARRHALGRPPGRSPSRSHH